MKIVYLSNSFNHYQKAFSDAMYEILGENYVFIESEEQEKERIDLGWLTIQAPYLKRLYTDGEETCLQIIDGADVLVYGPGVAPHHLVRKRANEGKLIFACTERVLKKGDSLKHFLPRFVKYNYYFLHRRNTYLLCMGAYVHSDFKRMGLFKDRAFKFGYFPSWIDSNIDALLKKKNENSIVWVARMIDWKHPELAISVAQKLRESGIIFHMDMVGNGQLLEQIRSEVREKQLEDYVDILGPKTPDEVRNYMDKAEIFLFTSDRNEGWGVVLNEAMNSACVPVADRAIGSIPYVLCSGENGVVYDKADADLIAANISTLFEDQGKRERMAKNAYMTIRDCWSPDIAANRLVRLADCLLHREPADELFADGPCSKIKE